MSSREPGCPSLELAHGGLVNTDRFSKAMDQQVTGQANFPLINYTSTQPQTVAILFSDLACDATTYARVVEKGVNTEWAFVVNWGSNISPWTGNRIRWQPSPEHHLCKERQLVGDLRDGECSAEHVCQRSVECHQCCYSGCFGSRKSILFRAGGGSTNFSTAKLAGLWVWNRVLTAGEISAHATNPWQMFPSPSSYYLDYLGLPSLHLSRSGLAISGGPAAARRDHRQAWRVSDQRCLRRRSLPWKSPQRRVWRSAGPTAGATAGPSPGVTGMAISGAFGGTAETVTVLIAGLGIGGALGVVLLERTSTGRCNSIVDHDLGSIPPGTQRGSAARAYGPVTAGMVFQGVARPEHSIPPTSFLGPMVNAVSRPGAAQYPTESPRSRHRSSREQVHGFGGHPRPDRESGRPGSAQHKHRQLRQRPGRPGHALGRDRHGVSDGTCNGSAGLLKGCGVRNLGRGASRVRR